MVTGEFLPALTELFNHSGWFWMRSMIFLSERAANLPGAWFHVRTPGAGIFFLYYGLLFALCAGWWKRPALRWMTIVSAFALALGCWVAWKREHSWHRITALPLHGGHAVYVQPRGTSEWLIDCGDSYAVDFTLKPFLQAQGVNSLANFLVTQGDVRQIGGVSHLQQVFPVRQAFSSPAPLRSPRYREALSELALKSKLRRCATNGFKATPWTVLHPDSTDRFISAGDNAVVSLGTFDGVRVLLVPNLSKVGQNAIAARHPQLTADIVIAGLPSAGEPLASDWLSALRPKLVIVADSELPATRRASPGLAKRIRKSGATVLFTRQAGAVILTIRDGEWRLKAARHESEGEMEFSISP
jgi:beta-lactamase superfamily II metal-dependent hydrolase